MQSLAKLQMWYDIRMMTSDPMYKYLAKPPLAQPPVKKKTNKIRYLSIVHLFWTFFLSYSHCKDYCISMQQENFPQTLSIVGSEVVAILSQEVKNREEKNQTNYSNEDSPEKKSGEISGSRVVRVFEPLMPLIVLERRNLLGLPLLIHSHPGKLLLSV